MLKETNLDDHMMFPGLRQMESKMHEKLRVPLYTILDHLAVEAVENHRPEQSYEWKGENDSWQVNVKSQYYSEDTFTKLGDKIEGMFLSLLANSEAYNIGVAYTFVMEHQGWKVEIRVT